MGIRARVFLLVFFSLAVSIRIAYVIAERDITSTFEEQTIFQLEKQAYLLLESVNEISKLDKSEANAIANRLGEASDSRVTLILNNGTVVGDSSLTKEQISILDNHINRKEIQEALINGKGWSSRYSSTLDQQLLYFAVTDQDVLNPNIIRIAVPYTYLDRVISSLNISIFLIGAVAFVVSFIASALIFNYTYRSLSELEDAISSLSVNPLKNNDIEASQNEKTGEFDNVARSISQISEVLKSQVKLIAKQRNQFGSVLDDLGEGVIVFNHLSHITYNNDKALQILNLKDDINNLTIESLAIKAITNLYEIASKKKKANKEFEIDMGNGSTRWVLGSINQSNSANQYILVVHDITQLRKLDSMRRDFVSNVSHELRTPVSVIRANSETLLSGALDNKEDAELFSKAILHNAERLTEMVSDLIDLSRIEYGEVKLNFEPVNINRSILGALDSIKGLASKKEISLIFEEYEDMFVWVDTNAIERILINLLDNAIKYSPQKSSVKVNVINSDKYLEVNVIDSGKGIDDTDKKRIFGRFYRTAQARASDKTGSGLGLAIVKNLAHSLNGDVGVRNSDSGGCNFWFTIPKAK
ncbi:ATP-binding protein [Gammaproteobacteria bacterium]|nr:ATP-binding protein [Gammaproteobacteria bacterium]MDA7786790.1 ATP-binding protein [Gammaproteobacteria bacterium]MDA9039122.1 ATP-binding protein [Gammaproteobacteria bacterium]MDA9045364.1 ATP-binding protein [Gammaproteobacteria bacterium]